MPASAGWLKIPVYRPLDAAFAATDPAEGAASQKRGRKLKTAAFPAETWAISTTAFTHIPATATGATARISDTGSAVSVQYHVITMSASGSAIADSACETGCDP